MKRSQSDLASTLGSQANPLGSVIRPVPIPPPRQEHQSPTNNDQRLSQWIDRESRVLPPLPQEPPVHRSTPTAKFTVDETVASTDLQNPADALEFLAHVAERDSGPNQLPPMYAYGKSHRPPATVSGFNEFSRNVDQVAGNNVINYPPLIKGQLSLEMIQALLAR